LRPLWAARTRARPPARAPRWPGAEPPPAATPRWAHGAADPHHPTAPIEPCPARAHRLLARSALRLDNSASACTWDDHKSPFWQRSAAIQPRHSPHEMPPLRSFNHGRNALGSPHTASQREDAMVAQSKNQAWLAQVEEKALEPNLPICDPHHHLWDFRKAPVQERYLLEEILGDVGGGHNVVATVFIECGAMFKAEGPEAFRCVGETEFVNGIAAMSASGSYGKTRIAAGIVGTVDLRI